MNRKLFKIAVAVVLLLSVMTIAGTPVLSVLTPAVSAQTQSIIAHPYFFDKPRDGMSTSTAAKTVSWVTLSRGNGWRYDLRNAGYNGPILVYFMGTEVEGAGPYRNSSASCNGSLYPASNTVAYERGDFCKYVHPNESWFLHNGRGDRLYDRRGSTSVSYQMNPASSGWRQYARTRLARNVSGSTALSEFDGIFLDNIAMRLYKLNNQISNSDGRVKEYSSDSAYRTQVASYLGYLNDALDPLWANIIDDAGVSPDDQMRVVSQLDGWLNEAWGSNWMPKDLTSDRWLEHLEIAERTLGMGKGFVANAQGDRYDYKRQTFAFASYLLVNDTSRRGRFRFSNYHDGYSGSLWQYDNYKAKLGTPKGRRYKSGNLWRRDYTCGYVTADPNTHTGRIVPSACTSGVVPTPEPTPPPSSGSGVALPGRLEAEKYTGFYDKTNGNQGGEYRDDDVDIEKCSDGSNCYAVSHIESGEWVSYKVDVSQSGDYLFSFRIAANDSGQRLHVEVDGQNVTGTITLPGSGSWNSWKSSSGKTVRLSAGSHTIKVVAESGWYNLNYISVTR